MNPVRKQSRLGARTIAAGCFLLYTGVCGCITVPPPSGDQPSVQAQNPTGGDQKLAGTWNYHDGHVVYCLTLNQEGHGAYNWQDGHFITTSLTGNQWEGRWYQAKNDREGKFYLHLSPDGNSAEGEWWYTRIENNHSPTQPGDRFALQRMPCSSGTEIDTVLIPPDK